MKQGKRGAVGARLTSADVETLRSSRLKPTSIAVFQLGGTAMSFLAWALVANIATPEGSLVAVRAYAWALLIFQPLSLGLPYILPNEYRVAALGTNVRRRVLLIFLLGTASMAAVVGTILTINTADSVRSLGLALLLAAVTCVAIALQQISRVQNRVGLMFFSTIYMVILPASWALTSAQDARVLVATSALVVYFLILAVTLSRFVPHRQRHDSPGQGLRRVLGTALPLVPHLFAFGALMQGLRVLGSMTDDAKLANEAHLLMLVVSAGYTTVTSVHTLLAVRTQTLSEADLPSALKKTAVRYVALGVSSSLLVFGIFMVPIEEILPGIITPSLFEVGLLTMLPGILSSYYYLSALFIRFGYSATLSAVTVTILAVAASGFIWFLSQSTAGYLIRLYALAMLLLLGLIIIATLFKRALRQLSLFVPIAMTVIAIVPGGVITLVGFLF